MAETYWITFCIAPHGSEEWRCQALLAAVRRVATGSWWAESVNFLLFRSDHGIEHIAAELARALDTDTDLVLLSRAAGEEARAIGPVTDGRLYELLPGARSFRLEPVSAAAPVAARRKRARRRFAAASSGT